MKPILATISFIFIFKAVGFSQDSIANRRSIFEKGVRLKNPDYNFQWNFKIDHIPKAQFVNYQVNEIKVGVWTQIKFDSVVFNDFFFKHVIVKVTKKKGDDTYKMREFIGFVNSETLDKMVYFFNYDWKGWIFFPKEKPLYKFRLFKTKSERGISIISN